MAVVKSMEARKRDAAFSVLLGMVMCSFIFLFQLGFLVYLALTGNVAEDGLVFVAVYAGLSFLGILGCFRMDGKLALVQQVGMVVAAFYVFEYTLIHDLGILMAKGCIGGFGTADCFDDGFYDQHKVYCDGYTTLSILGDISFCINAIYLAYVFGHHGKAIHTLKTLPEPFTRPPFSSTLSFIRTLFRALKSRPLSSSP